MRKNKTHASGVVSGILLPMGLICLFAFCSLALSLMGGTAYRSIQSNIDEAYDSIIASSYLRTKLAQNNVAGAVSLREEEGVQLLVIDTEIGDTLYETRIYAFEGSLYESFSSPSRPFTPGEGTRLAQVASCTFTIDGHGLLEAQIASGAGEVTRTVFALAGGGA